MPRGVINTRPERMLISGRGQGRRRQRNYQIPRRHAAKKRQKKCIAKRCARRSLAPRRRAMLTSAVCGDYWGIETKRGRAAHFNNVAKLFQSEVKR